jgi:hypothetical protein
MHRDPLYPIRPGAALPEFLHLALGKVPSVSYWRDAKGTREEGEEHPALLSAESPPWFT